MSSYASEDELLNRRLLFPGVINKHHNKDLIKCTLSIHDLLVVDISIHKKSDLDSS